MDNKSLLWGIGLVFGGPAFFVAKLLSSGLKETLTGLIGWLSIISLIWE